MVGRVTWLARVFDDSLKTMVIDAIAKMMGEKLQGPFLVPTITVIFTSHSLRTRTPGLRAPAQSHARWV